MRDVRIGQRHLCGSCRYEAEQYRKEHPGQRRVRVEHKRRRWMRGPAQAWWESDAERHVVKYTKPEMFQHEADEAEQHGWHAVSADSFDGRAVGAIGTPAMLIALRALGSITVVWERDPVPVNGHAPNGQQADDPVETLRRLKEMLDLQLIAEPEYEAKKAEVLERM